MLIEKHFSFDTKNPNFPYQGKYDEPTICPMCKHAIKPQELHMATYSNNDGAWFLSAQYLCKHCYQTFITLHSCSLVGDKNDYEKSYTSNLLYSAPNHFIEKEFDDALAALSPQFVKIYNQSLAADAAMLDEIAGLGYRKALEFLIKDFCVHIYPDAEDKIKNLPLSKCIAEYVNSSEIKALATRAAWIGNDEAHYIRKQEEHDISDMKRFIQAAVYFIGMVLITEEAKSISPA